MGLLLFVFGLPGSGKSAAARQIKSFARKKHFKPRRFKDYTILYRMFQNDQATADYVEKRFRSTKKYSKYDGFDVLNFDVFDEALQKLYYNIMKYMKKIDDNAELLIIEFSRDDYCEALSLFPTLRLNDAYFLFINSEISACKTRIKARADHPRTLDDRYVSDYIFEAYYKRDHQQYITEVAQQLKQRFGVPIEHIHVIGNGPGISVKQFYQAVESFVNDLLMIKV